MPEWNREPQRTFTLGQLLEDNRRPYESGFRPWPHFYLMRWDVWDDLMRFLGEPAWERGRPGMLELDGVLIFRMWQGFLPPDEDAEIYEAELPSVNIDWSERGRPKFPGEEGG